MSKRVVGFYKKDGKTRPITKRVPYGVPRSLALEEVERLRKEGERARLIETNRNRRLYAPYESELKRVESHKESETQGSGKGNVEKQNETKDTVQNNNSTVKSISNELALNALKELNIINDKNEWNYNKKDEITKWSNVMYVRDGVLKYSRMDPTSAAYIQTEIPTRLSDGFYKVEFDDPGFNGTRVLKAPTEMPEIKPLEGEYEYSRDSLISNARGPLEQHKFNYDNSLEFKLEGENLKRFVKALRDQSDDLILFEKADKFIQDPIRPERGTIREVIKVKTQSDVPVDPPPTREIMEIIPDRDTIPNLPKGTVSKYAKSYIYKSMEAILGKNQVLNPKTPMTINVKNDYPILLRTQWKIGDKDEAKSYGLIAPRINEA
jgi:hypothetical protein